MGIALDFPEQYADVRVIQYESGSKTPKEVVFQKMAEVLKVKPRAITDPDFSRFVVTMILLPAAHCFYRFRLLCRPLRL